MVAVGNNKQHYVGYESSDAVAETVSGVDVLQHHSSQRHIIMSLQACSQPDRNLGLASAHELCDLCWRVKYGLKGHNFLRVVCRTAKLES